MNSISALAVVDSSEGRGRLQLRPAPAVARRPLACHHPGLRRNCPGSKDYLNQRQSLNSTLALAIVALVTPPVDLMEMFWDMLVNSWCRD